VKHGYSDKPMVSGETVTPGKYRCLECGYRHKVEKGVVNLPVCPRCQGDTWRTR
jgi:Zn finger protein HypA/HybF involved in hydrogenase expression